MRGYATPWISAILVIALFSALRVITTILQCWPNAGPTLINKTLGRHHSNYMEKRNKKAQIKNLELATFLTISSVVTILTCAVISR